MAFSVCAFEWRSAVDLGYPLTLPSRLIAPPDSGFALTVAANTTLEQFGAAIADTFRVGDDARQRWRADAADQVVVVHADDSDFLRHRDSGLGADIEHMLSPKVVATHDTHGLLERVNPPAEPVLLVEGQHGENDLPELPGKCVRGVSGHHGRCRRDAHPGKLRVMKRIG